jgi:thiosulfate reductase cytochrome b subunit
MNGSDIKIKIHPLYVRIFHWINAIAMVLMIMSGWQIYNAAPVFEWLEAFPDYLTLGGWLGGGIQFHLAVMWVFVINLLIYFIVSIVGGHYRRSLFPVTPKSVVLDLGKALKGKLPHEVGKYNAVQKISYIGVITLMILVLLSGLAIWKSVQFQTIGLLFGGYDGARIVHFVCMSLICAFILMHLVLVAIVPSTFIPMITGWAKTKKESDHVA